ncbi:MAG: tetratricopeptide repeat-containing serine/threonine protein kinase [Pseudomonadota bacterium]|nr:tetratricopeptide repeat-containing serine/threonine protein kinase [Pseudomonadota bacterium]
MSDTPQQSFVGPTSTGIYAQTQFAPGTLIAGRFRIESMLGIGGMGVVYRATDTTLNVPVAIKLLRPELAQRPESFERFRQELLLARQVSSPRVVRIHDLAQHEGQWLIGMDFVDGEALDRRLDRDGQLPIDEALRITRQLAEGLSAAHARDVVHRDLKPANVLIDRAGDAFISDFGVARSLASTGLTQSGAVIGTPDYLSPEQARGEAVDGRSDLYALGLILYEMLAGAMPFAGGTVSETLAQRMLHTPPPVTRLRADAPAWVARLVDKLLRPQPAHRFRNAEEVIQAIDRREVPRELHPRRGVVVSLIALLVLALGTGWWWSQRDALESGSANVVAELPPLHRLLVLPIEHDTNALSQPLAVALGTQLQHALANAPGLAVVDAERAQQALRQLDPTGTARPDAAALRRIAAADRVLRVSLQKNAASWQAQAQLQTGNGAPVRVEASGDDVAAALRNSMAQPAMTLALALASPLQIQLPESQPALEAYGAGLHARQRGALGDAQQQLRKVTDSTPQYAAGWLALGEVAQMVGDQETAYSALERAERVASDAPERLRKRIAADRALLDGDAPTAVAVWRALLQANPDDTFAELNLARAQGSGGDYATAIAGLQKLIERDANDPRAWFELGKLSILQGEARRGVDEYLVRALVLNKRSRNTYGEAETVNALGIGYGRLGQTGDAEEQFRKAVELRRSLGNRNGLATSLRNLANVLGLQGEFEEAASSLQQARALHVELGDRGGLAAVEEELGLLAEERGDYAGALAAFRRALAAWQQVGDQHRTAQALNDIGFAQYQLGAYDDAQAYLVQSSDIYEELDDHTGRIRTQQNLGLLAMARGRWGQARDLLQKSLAAAEQQQMLEEAAVSHRNLAELEFLQGHLGAALTQIGKADTLFRQREDQRGIADAGLLRAQVQIAARADVAARKTLDDLADALKQGSTEQRGIASLLRSQLAARAGDNSAPQQSLQQARQLARQSGVRLLQLQVAVQTMRSGRADGTLDAATAALGHVALRLNWIEAAMQQALDARDAVTALRLYREALPLLRRGDYVHAHRLHTLGARAATASGDANASADATAAARATLQRLREQLPAALRDGFDAAREQASPAPADS